MSLIALAVYDTDENKRTAYTRRTLYSLLETVDFDKHKLRIVDNNSCTNTLDLYKSFQDDFPFRHGGNNLDIRYNLKNIGTAEAINLAWKQRKKGENCIKMDNDVVFHSEKWVDEMEEAIKREPKIGQIGLKRKDLAESPNQTEPHYKSELLMLPHKAGERWIVVEKCNHIMGTVQMYSSALLDKIGYLKQPFIYGYDDSLASLRSSLAGFINVFLSHIEIDHIDDGQNPYTQTKRQLAAESMNAYNKLVEEYRSGKIPLYYNPYE